MDFESINLKIRTLVEVLVIPLLSFGVYLLSDMNKNIQVLNTQVAIILAERDLTKDQLKDHETRLRILERIK
jgi:hypothetical protein